MWIDPLKKLSLDPNKIGVAMTSQTTGDMPIHCYDKFREVTFSQGVLLGYLSGGLYKQFSLEHILGML